MGARKTDRPWSYERQSDEASLPRAFHAETDVQQ
jgi:hypothetical protein